MWRWDQGRLLYFQFDVLKNIASVLVKFDGVKIRECESLFRIALTQNTGMPFAPEHYTVLRNYKRVFECAFLATVIDEHLVVSDYCRELAKEDGCFGTAEEFFLSYVGRFRFPFPAFDNYDIAQTRVYPFCAIIKYLIALSHTGRQSSISLDEIGCLIIANNCTGLEDLEFYARLIPKAYVISETERRQLREMVIFISQISILKVYDGRLWLDITDPSSGNKMVDRFLSPVSNEPEGSRGHEFLSLTRIVSGIVLPTIEMFSSDVADIEFVEGKRKRIEHFRVDRSPLLRRYYIEHNHPPVCGMCRMDVSIKYPWTDYMLDIHHLLPLSSSIGITQRGTSLRDIVGLCPTCHRSVHIYYTKWLKRNGQEDFRSRTEAMDVYLSAIREIA